MLASMSGVFVDLRQVSDHPSLNPDPAAGYSGGNEVAAAGWDAGYNGIIYPSVRHEGAPCSAALWPNVVQSVVQGAMYRLTWAGKPELVVDAL